MNEKLEEKLNEQNEFLNFYKNYFIDYWEIKYKYIKVEIENIENQKSKLAEVNDFNTIPQFNLKFLSMLKFDLHFMKFQIIETLFSFIFALEKQDDTNLFYNISFPGEKSQRSVATYDKISNLNKKHIIDEYFKKKTEKIEVDNQLIPFWQYLFFFNVDVSKFEKEIDKIEENIITILFQLASTFTDRDDYSAYKHSLRCYKSSLRLSIKPGGSDRFIPLGYEEDVMVFLTKKAKDNDTLINLTFKAFSVEEDLYYIEKTIELLKNILNTRRAYFFGEKLKPINYFKEIQRKFLHEKHSILKFSKSTTSLNRIFIQGLNARDQGMYAEAISYFEKVLQVEKLHYETIFQLGFCHFLIKNYDKAIEYYEKYIKNTFAKYWKQGLFNLALCYFKKTDFQKAEKNLRRYLKKYEKENDQITDAARFLSADINLILNQQYFSKNGKNKFNYIKKAEKLLRKTEEIEFRHPEIWFKLAFLKDTMKKFKESKNIYKNILEIDSNNLFTILNLAKNYCLEDKLEKMENLLQKALQINDKYFNTWNGIAMLKDKQGKMDEFYEACNKSLKYCSNDEQRKGAYNNLGYYHKSIGDYQKGFEFFKKAVDIDKKFGHAFLGLLDCLWELKKCQEIIEYTEDLDFTMINAQFLNLRAYALSELNEFDKAEIIIKSLIPIIKKNNRLFTNFHDTMGDIYRKKGDLRKAIGFYQKALDDSETEYNFLAETKKKLEKCKKELDLI